MIVHVEHFTFARAELFHHNAYKLLRHVDRQLLDRLHELAVHSLGYDLGLSDHEFEAFAAHHLDQDGKLQLAPSHHHKGISAFGVLDAERNVGQKFFLQSFAEIPGSDVCALATGER